MALKPCKECGAPVSDEAKACPQCGAKLQPKTTKVVWFAAIAMFAVLLPKCFMDKAAESEPVTVVEQKPAKQPEFNNHGKTDLGFKDISVCTASALKSQQLEQYKLWFDTMAVYYKSLNPTLSNLNVEGAMIGVMQLEVKELQQAGYSEKSEFQQHYLQNCKNIEPKR